ncbi:hypothetical protein VOWphi5012_018 [Vibrio phage phi50-12]|uniref:Uncharacterized protein n=1 Tax=Vibrio phage phi50-12 TaxID=2654972 RepID=A0A5P8PRA0_9CAUD|nr:hypothetical protein KNU82_gp018 [Vibrio phage phi50-12]QFR59802.1 hypothetical protein VOWphi5012_018 [Vibrio phage phi50-12]
MAITWRNISAPDLSASASILGQAGQSLNQATEGLVGLFDQARQNVIQEAEAEKKANTFQALDAIRTADEETYGEMSLGSLIDEFGSIDQDAVFTALDTKDDDIMQGKKDALNLQNLELSNQGKELQNKVTKNTLDQTIKEQNKTERLSTINDAASKVGLELGALKGVDDVTVKNMITKAGEAQGLTGSDLVTFVNTASQVNKDLRALTPTEQLLYDNQLAKNNAGLESVTAQADAQLNQIIEQNPIDPVFTPYQDIKDISSAISGIIEKYPEGFLNFVGTGNQLRSELEDKLDRFAKDNGIKKSDIPPTVVAAALDSGIVSNKEFLTNDKADTSNFSLDLEKYYSIYQNNQQRAANIANATRLRNDAVSRAQGIKQEADLAAYKSANVARDILKQFN